MVLKCQWLSESSLTVGISAGAPFRINGSRTFFAQGKKKSNMDVAKWLEYW